MYDGRVHFLPKTVRSELLYDGTAVVIDVLRATTTICHALAAGARDVRPCPNLEVTQAVVESLDRKQIVLGGERRGEKLRGFDLGNSPAEYTADRVAGKIIVFTTTNGTRAIERCDSAKQIVLASFVNRAAVCRWLADRPSPLDIVCAGTNGKFTREDVLAAGAIVDGLTALSDRPRWVWNDEALVAHDAWRGVWCGEQQVESLVDALRHSLGGANLIELGYDADIEAAARVDSLEVVPRAGNVSIFVDANKRATS
ncbi:MAG: 2-phosphosulfolactate phosphatase [Pirellulales bacterium]